ncbi:MAG TPA: iron ABC transporter permease [Burkholderiaceae bacterium]|nr:iron ABC transporter permease [Burkholderiaceae bacterium]
MGGSWLRWGLAVLLGLLIGVVLLPIGGVFSALWDAQAWATLAHLAATVIPAAAMESAILVVLVVLGVAFLGSTAAWLVTAYEFRGRSFFEWALLLPMAVPAYIVAYAYTDALQYAGPVQSALRSWMGWGYGDYVFPQIRSVPGAAFVFTVVLYPYVYLLARTAFLARTACMQEAARSLGMAPLRAWWHVDLPLARPAIVAGSLLALMETLADYGAASYFGLQTFTTAIYRAWFSHGDRMAAAQLSMVLLLVVLCVIALEQRARGKARFFAAPNSIRPASRQPLQGGRGAAAALACCVPLGLGFVLPLGLLLRLMPPWEQIDVLGLRQALTHTAFLGVAAALIVVGVVIVMAYALRYAPKQARLPALAARALGLGYAVPGAVIAVGVLIPLAAFDNALDAWVGRLWGWHTGLLLTGSVAALLYAYLVRYFAVAHQPIEAGLAGVTESMEASARCLGAGPVQAFARVHLPLIFPSVLAAALLVFVDVVKELPATLVLRPFDFDTLAIMAYHFASDERLGHAAVPALAIVAAGLLPVLLLSRVIGRGVRRLPAAEVTP